MRKAVVIEVNPLSSVPHRDAGCHPVLEVLTNLPAGDMNAFYMDKVDLDGIVIKLPLCNQPPETPVDPEALNDGDTIEFDVQDGIHKVVLWNGRKVRQRDYSYDWLKTHG